jgi:hypothetical protein
MDFQLNRKQTVVVQCGSSIQCACKLLFLLAHANNALIKVGTAIKKAKVLLSLDMSFYKLPHPKR